MNIEPRKFLRKEPICLKQDYFNLINLLKEKHTIIDERLLKVMGERVGMRSSDEKVYKLISVYIESQINDIITSINHKHKSEISQIRKKYQEIQNDSKISRKKFQNIQRSLMN